MNVGLAIEMDLEAEPRSSLLQEISVRMEEYFSSKHYGDGLQNIDIGFICMRARDGYTEFFKERKPKFIKSNVVNLIGGGRKELGPTLTFDVRLAESHYNTLLNGSEQSSMEVIVECLLASTDKIEMFESKIADFDFSSFKNDYVSFLESI